MNKDILIPLFFIVSTFCKGEINTDSTVRKAITDSILVSSDNLTLVLYGLSAENFDVKINADTIFTVKKLYEGIDDLQILFLSSDYGGNVLKGEIIYGANQYLIDDIGVVPLDFTFKDSVQIHKTDDRYLIQSAIKENNIMEHFFEKTFFREIKKKSYALQKNFYQKEVLDKEKYDCCPEYIEQAKDFLAKKETDFRTIRDLALEIAYKKITLKLSDDKYLVFYND